MRVIVFDTETNGLPKGGNKSRPDPHIPGRMFVS